MSRNYSQMVTGTVAGAGIPWQTVDPAANKAEKCDFCHKENRRGRSRFCGEHRVQAARNQAVRDFLAQEQADTRKTTRLADAKKLAKTTKSAPKKSAPKATPHASVGSLTATLRNANGATVVISGLDITGLNVLVDGGMTVLKLS